MNCTNEDKGTCFQAVSPLHEIFILGLHPKTKGGTYVRNGKIAWERSSHTNTDLTDCQCWGVMYLITKSM